MGRRFGADRRRRGRGVGGSAADGDSSHLHGHFMESRTHSHIRYTALVKQLLTAAKQASDRVGECPQEPVRAARDQRAAQFRNRHTSRPSRAGSRVPRLDCALRRGRLDSRLRRATRPGSPDLRRARSAGGAGRAVAVGRGADDAAHSGERVAGQPPAYQSLHSFRSRTPRNR